MVNIADEFGAVMVAIIFTIITLMVLFDCEE
jgi:hypothetical protein